MRKANLEMHDIKLKRREPQELKLPHNIKMLSVGEHTVLCRWNGFGWRQISPEETKRIIDNLHKETE